MQVKVTGASTTKLKGLEVNLINSPEVSSDARPQTMAAEPQTATTASAPIPNRYPEPTIISRKGWGGGRVVADHLLHQVRPHDRGGCRPPHRGQQLLHQGAIGPHRARHLRVPHADARLVR